MGRQNIEGAVRVCPEGRLPEPERVQEVDRCGSRTELALTEAWVPWPMHQGLPDCLKETLGATEAEWKVVAPQLARVMALLRPTVSRQHVSLDPDGPCGGPEMGRGPETRGRQLMGELAKATEALEASLDDAQSSVEEIRTRLKVLREVHRRGKQRLSEARAVVLGLVTPQQEAQLVLMGILD